MYIPGLTELLIAKGAAWIAAHMTAISLTHLASYVVAHGVVVAIATLTPIVITSSFIIGGVIWSGEKLKLINDLLEDIKNENIFEATVKIIKIANLLHSTYSDAADSINVLLTKYYGDNGEINQICSTIKDIASKIDEKT